MVARVVAAQELENLGDLALVRPAQRRQPRLCEGEGEGKGKGEGEGEE